LISLAVAQDIAKRLAIFHAQVSEETSEKFSIELCFLFFCSGGVMVVTSRTLRG